MRCASSTPASVTAAVRKDFRASVGDGRTALDRLMVLLENVVQIPATAHENGPPPRILLP